MTEKETSHLKQFCLIIVFMIILGIAWFVADCISIVRFQPVHNSTQVEPDAISAPAPQDTPSETIEPIEF